MRTRPSLPLVMLALSACTPRLPFELVGPWGDGLPDEELEAREALAAAPIAVRGRVIREDGTPLDGVEVTVNGTTATTDTDGRYALTGVARHNTLMELVHADHRTERFPVHLLAPLTTEAVEVPTVSMVAWRPGDVRFLFAGDAALGRRFLDVDEGTPLWEIPQDDPLAIIQTSDPAPGTASTLQWVQPWIDVVDFPVCNLESPVLDRPDTPHETKPYVFFTLPGSLDALVDAGFRYVSLGNNHVYDYLEQGLADTLFHVSDRGLAHSGAGLTPDEAFRPWTTTLADRQ